MKFKHNMKKFLTNNKQNLKMTEEELSLKQLLISLNLQKRYMNDTFVNIKAFKDYQSLEQTEIELINDLSADYKNNL